MTREIKPILISFLALIIVVISFYSYLLVLVYASQTTSGSMEVTILRGYLDAQGYFVLRGISLGLLPAVIFSLGMAKKIEYSIRISLMKIFAITSSLVSLFFVHGTTIVLSFTEIGREIYYSDMGVPFQYLMNTELISLIILVLMIILLNIEKFH